MQQRLVLVDVALEHAKRVARVLRRHRVRLGARRRLLRAGAVDVGREGAQNNFDDRERPMEKLRHMGKCAKWHRLREGTGRKHPFSAFLKIVISDVLRICGKVGEQ